MKSIVPTWLQRYFKQNEEEASPTEQSNQEENVNYHSFADDITDNPLDIDGRITPEPTRISLEGRLNILSKLTVLVYPCCW